MIDRILINKLSDELLKAAQEIAGKYGVTVDLKGGRFSPSEFTTKIQFNVKGENGETNAEIEWNRYHVIYNLQKEWFGQMCNNGKKIIGLSRNRPKYPVELLCKKTGKKYKTTAESIIREFSNKKTSSFIY